jgi:Protein of unknown function (DUF1344)
MRGVLALLMILIASPAAFSQGSIPPGAQPPVAPSGATVEGQEAEGRITAVDPSARTIELDDRDLYTIPDGMRLNWAALREGTTVRLRYSVNDGRNIATGLRILFP